jgi:hypothetical protein
MLLEPSTFTVVPLGSDLGSGKEGLGLLDWALVPGNFSSDRFLNGSLMPLMLPEPSAFNIVPLGSDLGSGKEGLGLLDWATTGESIDGKDSTSQLVAVRPSTTTAICTNVFLEPFLERNILIDLILEISMTLH